MMRLLYSEPETAKKANRGGRQPHSCKCSASGSSTSSPQRHCSTEAARIRGLAIASPLAARRPNPGVKDWEHYSESYRVGERVASLQ